MTRIIIADDHPIVRAGLKQIVADSPDMEVIDEAGNGHELLDKVSRQHFDLVILDISMPGMDGLEALKRLKQEHPGLRVLVLTLHPEARYAVRSLRAGADGYLTKANAADELIKAIRKICRGRKYISATLAEKLVYELDSDSSKLPHETLSDREFQVMQLLASGKTVKEIADDLALSVKTISTYRSRILEKMRLKNNAQLMLYAIQNHLLD